MASQPLFLDKYWLNFIPTNMIKSPNEESKRKLMRYLKLHIVYLIYLGVKIYHVQGSPVYWPASHTLAKCMAMAPIPCLEVS